jgi:hypothetical protein
MDPSLQAYHQNLLEENDALIKSLEVMKRQFDIKNGERNQISALYEDHKQHYEAMRQRLALAERRLAEETHTRKEVEFLQEQRLADMKRAIDAKQRELEAMHAKLTLPVDTDILRMRIAKDMEARHRLELEAR